MMEEKWRPSPTCCQPARPSGVTVQEVEENILNYKSPISIISQQIKYQMEDRIMKAVQKVGIHVDKYELIRALQYDRDQYQKGYMDGFRDALDGKGQTEGGEESECF